VGNNDTMNSLVKRFRDRETGFTKWFREFCGSKRRTKKVLFYKYIFFRFCKGNTWYCLVQTKEDIIANPYVHQDKALFRTNNSTKNPAEI
jgi:hypothetical protein